MCKKCKTCGIEKPLEDFNKDNSTKDKLNYSCRVCSNAKVRKWREDNPESFEKSQRASEKKYWAKPENKERHRKHSKTYRTRHQEKSKQASKNYKKRNPDKEIAYRKVYDKIHRAEKNARYWKYQAAKRKAIPAWSELKAVSIIYAKCARLTKWLEVAHNVDHIVPLQSDLVCGLHCEANLRIVPQTENLSKGNRHWPDMWQ